MKRKHSEVSSCFQFELYIAFSTNVVSCSGDSHSICSQVLVVTSSKLARVLHSDMERRHWHEAVVKTGPLSLPQLPGWDYQVVGILHWCSINVFIVASS
jgi:hypothetical protein